MFRPQSRLILGLLLVLLATPLLAGTIYHWKDARGVSHYSDSPPPKGAAQVRQIGNGAPAQPTAPADTPATPATADNAQCAQARLNLVRLQGDAEVGLDADRDGKPDAPLSAADRAVQVTLAESAIKTHCPGTT